MRSIHFLRRRSLFALLFVALLGAQNGRAAWVSFTQAFDPGTGFAASIPDDGASSLTNAIIVSGLANLPAAGSNVRIRLIGFDHDYASDLIVRVTFNDGVTNVTQTVFSEICLPSASRPEGCAANFGTVLTDYLFQANAPNNLWTTALALGDVDTINAHSETGGLLDLDGNGQPFPAVYAGSNAGSDADNLLFIVLNGLSANGTWTIEVFDAYNGAGSGTGSILAWGVDIFQTEVPEPATAWFAAAGLMALGWQRRQRQPRKRR